MEHQAYPLVKISLQSSMSSCSCQVVSIQDDNGTDQSLTVSDPGKHRVTSGEIL
jgi:hypothetical protein